jgi:ketosteroid isomerase-like protein
VSLPAEHDAAAHVEIQQLAFRYALAVDSRDLDGVANLFSATSDFSRWGPGREGCKRFFEGVWNRFGRSIHAVTTQVIRDLDGDTAHGVVYCRAEQQQLDDGAWWIYQLAYFDRYIREEDGVWRFLSRNSHFWYVDQNGDRKIGYPGRRQLIPEAWETWAPFWDSVESQGGDVADVAG